MQYLLYTKKKVTYELNNKLNKHDSDLENIKTLLKQVLVARNYIFSLILVMLWSETGYFVLLGNKRSLHIILLYLIKR